MPFSSMNKVCIPPAAMDSIPAPEAEPNVPSSMFSSTHGLRLGLVFSPRSSGPAPNWPKFPAPQTNRFKAGLWAAGAVGSALKGVAMGQDLEKGGSSCETGWLVLWCQK